MNKPAITDSLTKHYASFVTYIMGLTPEEYGYSYNQKWTAEQQLQHIVLSVKPLVQVFSMDALSIEKAFGAGNTPSRSYDVLLNEYTEKLKEGGKAPGRYVPGNDAPEPKAALCETLTSLIKKLCFKIESFPEEELDRLLIPHPLLGNITLREMLYNAIYHVEHHHEAAKENLKNKMPV